MNTIVKRFVVIAVAVVVLFIATAAGVFILGASASNGSRTPLFTALIAGGIAAALSLPLLIVVQSGKREVYSAHALEEIDLDEDELTKAVTGWVFMQRRQRVEGAIRFLEDDDGNVIARTSVRKD